MDTSSDADGNPSGDNNSSAPAPGAPTADAPGAPVDPPGLTKSRLFEIGPNFPCVRKGRPYFLVPLDRTEAEQNGTRDRIVAHLVGKKPVTDIFIVSHGWHRNFYGAVAAYDRIAARNAQLLHRERFETIRRGPPFHPLFLMLHWNSDPGENRWVDHAGRRSKTGFLEACEQRFVRPDSRRETEWPARERFTSVFEDLFDLFSKMSAPDSDALDAKDDTESKRLADILTRPEFVLRDAPGASVGDKIAAVWSAYHTAPVRAFVVNQSRKPGHFIGPGEAAANAMNFLLRVAPLALLLGTVLPFLRNRFPIKDLEEGIKTAFRACVAIVADGFHLTGDWGKALTAILWMLALSGLAALLLGVLALSGREVAGQGDAINVRGAAGNSLRDSGRPKDRIGLFRLIGWLLVAVPLAIPLLVFLFTAYFVVPAWLALTQKFTRSKRAPRSPGLFDERFGERGSDIKPEDHEEWLDSKKQKSSAELPIRGRFVRYQLARLARSSVALLRAGLDAENPGHPLANAVDNQFAFWDMQVKGVAAGRQAAYFFSGLYEQLKGKELLDENVRIHLLGHSFGGLVVCNMARHLRHDDVCSTGGNLKVPYLSTICLLNAAISANWFEAEEGIVSYIQDGIGCIYSVSDTANGFYYPVANNGRLAAGWVGLHKVGGTPSAKGSTVSVRAAFTLPPPNNPAMFASLVMPPPLKAMVSADCTAKPLIVNLDGSRLLFHGSPALGGGHGDVFKDDVSHLCWAVTRIGL